MILSQYFSQREQYIFAISQRYRLLESYFLESIPHPFIKTNRQRFAADSFCVSHKFSLLVFLVLIIKLIYWSY